MGGINGVPPRAVILSARLNFFVFPDCFKSSEDFGVA